MEKKKIRKETMIQYRPILNTWYGMTTGVVPTDNTEISKHIMKMKDLLDATYHETVRKYILQNYFPIPPMGLSCYLNLNSRAITAKIETEKRV